MVRGGGEAEDNHITQIAGCFLSTIFFTLKLHLGSFTNMI
jgi:hypothetical protein